MTTRRFKTELTLTILFILLTYGLVILLEK